MRNDFYPYGNPSPRIYMEENKSGKGREDEINNKVNEAEASRTPNVFNLSYF